MPMTDQAPASPARLSAGAEFSRGWTIVLAAVIGIYASLATIPFYAVQNLFGPLKDTFGWDRGAVSLAITLMGVANFFTSYLTGALTDRFGSRPVALISGLLLAGALFMITLNNGSIVQFWISYFVMTVVAAGTLPLTYTRTVNQWFDTARGLALGFTLMGTSLAAMTMPLLYKAGIDAFGWKGVFYVGIGLILVLWLPVCLLLFKDRSKADQAAAAALATGMSLGEAARTATFWKMGIAFFLVTCAMSGIVIHIVAMVTENVSRDLVAGGMSQAQAVDQARGQAAGVAAIIGVSLLVARITVGFLVDKFHAPPIAALCFAIPAIGCYMLTGGGHGAAIFAAVMVGVALGAELDLIAFFTSRYFGMKNYGKIYGWQYVFYTVGAGLSPFAFGVVYDRFQTYDPALWASVVALLVSGLLMLTLPRYKRGGH
jgi:MFS family permease